MLLAVVISLITIIIICIIYSKLYVGMIPLDVFLVINDKQASKHIYLSTKMTGYQKSHESVEVLQFYCGELPFDVMYEGFLPAYPAFQLGFMSCMS